MLGKGNQVRMKRSWIKKVAALVIFIVTVLLLDLILNRDNVEVTTEMSKATLPVISNVVEGYKVYNMQGYRAKREEAFTKDSITPVTENREITFAIDDYGTKVEGISYEVRSADGERLIERGEVKQLNKTEEEAGFTIQLKDLIYQNEEYVFVTILTLNGGEKAYYYARFIENEEYFTKEKLDYVHYFHNITLGSGKSEEIQKYLPNIVFEEENLKHMFAESQLDDRKRKNIYRRFIPKEKIETTLEAYVQNCIDSNRTFYSFLAEGILGLVFRDLYGYDLAKGIIDISETLSDTHTGVDACMYNKQENIIVLGEAKFYEKLNLGMKQIISDFTSKNIKNKLRSFQTNIENCDEAYQIIIKNLGTEDYDELTIQEFMQQKIIFAGFVLHSESDVSNYGSQTFYDTYDIDSKQLKKHICDELKIDKINDDYEILLIHLPIKDKKELIVKVIEKSKKLLSGM